MASGGTGKSKKGGAAKQGVEQGVGSVGARPGAESSATHEEAKNAAAAAEVAKAEATSASLVAGEEIEKKMRKIKKKLNQIAEIKKKPAGQREPEEQVKVQTEGALQQELRLLENPKLRAQVKAQAEKAAQVQADAAAVLAAAKASKGLKQTAGAQAEPEKTVPQPKMMEPKPKAAAKKETKPKEAAADPPNGNPNMSDEDRTKAVRKITKKLKQIEEILKKDPGTLDADQQVKVAAEKGLRDELKQLENPWRPA